MRVGTTQHIALRLRTARSYTVGMNRNEITELLAQEPFRPLRVVMSSGESYKIARPGFAVPLKSDLFIALENGDRWRLCPYLHIATVEIASNGDRNGRPSRRRKRR